MYSHLVGAIPDVFLDVYQASYIVDEVKDKTGKDIDVSSWKKEFVEDLPEQQNGFVFFSYSLNEPSLAGGGARMF